MDNKKESQDLKQCYNSGVKPAIAFNYIIYLNDNKFIVKDQTITGKELHTLAGTNSDTHFIKMKTEKGKINVGPITEVNLTECGIERFIILPYKQETIDLHECYCEGVEPVITYKYLIKINREKYEVEQEEISREEILDLLGKFHDKHRVRMFAKKGKVILEPNQVIDLTKCGVERFVIEALDCTEGYVLNKEMKIPLSDKKYFKSIDNEVSFIKDSNVDWVIIRDFDIPKGYNVEKADVALLIPPHYPVSQIDMIYFYPNLKRQDGKQINQLSYQSIEEKSYQRWSRHRTSLNAWNSNIDDVESHLDLMISCLKAEFNKR